MDKFNVGDKIIFDRGDVHNKDCFLGIIIRKNQDLTYHVLYFDDYEKVIDYNVKPYTYTFSCQLYKKDTHAPVNMEFFSDWTIEQVEEFVERLFQNGELDYYEEWDEC